MNSLFIHAQKNYMFNTIKKVNTFTEQNKHSERVEVYDYFFESGTTCRIY